MASKNEVRSHFINKFSKILELPLDNFIVLNLETGIFNETINFCQKKNYELKWGNPKFKNNYLKIARKILANITYTPNAETVKDKIKYKLYKADEVATMTHAELFPDYWADLKLQIMAQYIDTKSPEEMPDGIMNCFKCKSPKTTYYQMQTRSADEPMTSYFTCLSCNHKWKM
jgi:DNA-directed RNA polymerase subunit M/transcription elongation factor TFIIS